MSFNHYYQSELTALRQLGKRFSERNPALAPFLGQGSQDPDVERLLEGFAFLTGRLRQKLDDELPELTHSLMRLLWPNYMRPVPAFCMLQFEPLQHGAASVEVPAGTLVESRPVNGACCRFQTTQTVEVHALQVTDLEYSIQGEGSLLRLQMMMTAGGNAGELQLHNLRLHLAGERSISQTLYLLLLRHLGEVQVRLLDADGQPLEGRLLLAADQVRAVGFGEDSALMPYPLNTFRGYRLLQEYFSFQDKFLAVDLGGLAALRHWPDALLREARGLELAFRFERSSGYAIRPGRENVLLHCTPIANLFRHDALPIRLDGRQQEHLLVPAEYEIDQCGVFAVESVTGWRPGGLGYEEYLPFESFEHDPDDQQQSSPHYSVRQHSGAGSDGLETWLRFSLRGGHQHETISIELTCTNLNLPRQLGVGDICLPGESTPEFLAFRNITRPTTHYAPPLEGDFLWRLISNMSLNYLSLSDVDALRVILRTYDFPGHYDRQLGRVRQRMLGGLSAIEHQHVDRLLKGLPVRGVRTLLHMDQERFAGEGDLFLFASLLNEFFALYTSLNSYHELHVRTAQGEEYAWTPRMGTQPVL